MADAVDVPAASPARARQLRAHLLTTHRDAVEQQYLQLWGMRAAAAACGVITLLLALVGLFGRVSGIFIFASFLPGGKVIAVAAALSIGLFGLAIIVLSLSRRAPARFVCICAAVGALLAVVRLIEHFVGADWGVGNLFLSRYLPSTELATGYQEFGATALIAVGVAISAFTWPRARIVAVILAIAAATAGAIVCLSYLLGRPFLYQTVEGPVSLPAAIAIAIMGVGLTIIARAWEHATDLVTEAIVEDDRVKLARLSANFERQRNELEAMLSNAPSGIVSFDRDGRITRINPAGKEMLGRAVLPGTEEAVGFRPDIVDEQGQPVPLEAAAPYRALRGETVTGMVVRLLGAARGPIWVSASAVPLYDSDANIDGALLVTTDITDLRGAREAAQRSANELQAIMDTAPVGIIFYDYQGNIRSLNETARESLGMTEELMRRPAGERFAVHDIVDEQGEPVIPTQGVVAAVLSGSAVRDIVVNFRNTPRGSVWLSVSGAPLPSTEGSGTAGVVAVFSDVTRLHEAQERAQQAANELETVLSSIADGVVVYDREGRVLRTNPAAERLLRYTAEARTMTWQERNAVISPLDRDNRPISADESPLGRALTGERTVGFTMRFRLLLQAEAEFTPWLSVSAGPVHHDGEVVGAVMVFADISHSRQVEEELLSYRDHLERLVRERTADLEANQQRLRALAADLVTAEQSERQRLASAIHDEVAQTLGVIKLRLQMLQADERAAVVATEIAGLIEMTAAAIQQSRAIMLELSPPILQKEGLVAALHWWAQQVREAHHLAVEVIVLSPVEKLGRDLEIAVFQAVKELVQNTIKHAHATQVTLSLACSDGQLVIEVADNGVGFDPVTTQATQTGGFGLFSVRERMAYLGGGFEIESAPNQGTRSRITLPIPCSAKAPSPA